MTGEVSRNSIIIQTGNTGGTEATKKGDLTTPPKPEDVSPLKSGLEFFKETMSGLKGKSFMEKIEFIGERIALRKEQKAEHKEQKAEFKEKMADYNLSLEKKAYMESLDRRDAEIAGVKDTKDMTGVPNLSNSTVCSWLVKEANTQGFGERVSTLMGSLLRDAERIIKEETTGKNEGKTFTREQAFGRIADKLMYDSTAVQFDGIDLKALNYIAKGLLGEGRTDKAELLMVIVDKFADARKPENAIKLFKDVALEHGKTAGDQSFLRAAGGKDAITQKFLNYGGKANELLDSTLAIWDKTKGKEAYKTLETDVRSIIQKAVNKGSIESFNLASVYPMLSEEGKKAVALLVKEFVADVKSNGLPDTLKGAVLELQSKVIEGNIEVGSKVSNLFVSTLLKNATPSITDNPGLHEGSDTKKTLPGETKQLRPEERIKEVIVNDKVSITLATLISGVFTGAMNGGLADGKINTMALANLQKDVLIPLGREISGMLTNVGMSEEGLKFRTDLIDRHAKYLDEGKHLKTIASYSPPPPEKGDVKDK